MAKTMQNRTRKSVKSMRSQGSISSPSILRRSLENPVMRSTLSPCIQKRLWTSMITRKEFSMKAKIPSRLQTILFQNRSEKLIRALKRLECLAKSMPTNLKMNKKKSNKAESYKSLTRESSRAKISLRRSWTKDPHTTQVLDGNSHLTQQIHHHQSIDNLPVNFHLAMRSTFLWTITQSLKRTKSKINRGTKSLTIKI